MGEVYFNPLKISEWNIFLLPPPFASLYAFCIQDTRAVFFLFRPTPKIFP